MLDNFITDNIDIKWKPTVSEIPHDLWNSSWPWVPFEKEIDPVSVQIELDSIDNLFVEHRGKDTYSHSGWSSICLHGISYDKTENFDQYGYSTIEEANYHWTEVCSKIPYIFNIVKSLPFFDYGRVRIMKLSPGGYIMPHTDGAGRIFGPFNFALTQPINCNFIFEGYGIVPFKAGRGFMLDLGIRHAIVNNSDQTRYHLIIHGSPTNDFYKGMINSIAKL